MSSNKNCGCQPETETIYKKCNECTPDIPCDCPIVDLDTKCILFKDDDIKCESTTVITKNLNLSDNLKNLVAYICQRFSDTQNYLRIINVGGGSEIYAGENLIGQKKLRTFTSADDSVTITQSTDTINFSSNAPLQSFQSVLDVDPFAQLGELYLNYYDNAYDITSGDISATHSYLEQNKNRLTIKSVHNFNEASIDLVQGIFNMSQRSDTVATTVNFVTPIVTSTLRFPAKSIPGSYIIATEDQIPTVDGSETKITAGTNISVIGSGTSGTPYVINATLAQLTSGTTTTVTGTGAVGTPYQVETKNLQKVISADYTLVAGDNNYSIKVNNGTTPITITVPTGLPENFFVGITQKSTADITISGAGGVTVTNPTGFKIKGQGYYVGIEQIGTSNSFDLLGNTKT